jgi:hypothetical protein
MARIVRGRHPGLAFDAPEVIRRCRNAAEHPAHMPFTDDARRNGARTWVKRDAEFLLGLEDAKAVVTQGKMPCIAEPAGGFEKPDVLVEQLSLQHIREDMSITPTAADWLEQLELPPGLQPPHADLCAEQLAAASARQFDTSPDVTLPLHG